MFLLVGGDGLLRRILPPTCSLDGVLQIGFLAIDDRLQMPSFKLQICRGGNPELDNEPLLLAAKCWFDRCWSHAS